jgi:predicted RND superfamily exporter protein
LVWRSAVNLTARADQPWKISWQGDARTCVETLDTTAPDRQLNTDLMGLVTAGVMVASFREHTFSRTVSWTSAVATGLFVICTFLPFLSWARALLWLLVAGIALVWREGRGDVVAALRQRQAEL